MVYDHLASERFLDEVPEESQKIYVGKKAGCHYMKQEEINRLLVDLAREGKNVVRLKGGDPFVFGRGGEEVMAVSREGIPYEVVSGVTSAIAALASAGIPVTHRAVSRSFHVMTRPHHDGGGKTPSGLRGICRTFRHPDFSHGTDPSSAHCKRASGERKVPGARLRQSLKKARCRTSGSCGELLTPLSSGWRKKGSARPRSSL